MRNTRVVVKKLTLAFSSTRFVAKLYTSCIMYSR